MAQHNIIQLHGHVPFFIEHQRWASIILPSWEKLRNRRKLALVQIMNNANRNNYEYCELDRHFQ